MSFSSFHQPLKILHKMKAERCEGAR